jgi:hypothetical protein
LNDEPYIDENGALHHLDPVTKLKDIERENCRRLLSSFHGERIRYFTNRIAALGQSARDFVVVVISVDDPIGKALAEALMPGHDWSAIREAGQEPWARGFADRGKMQELCDLLDAEQGNKLRDILGLAVITVVRRTAFVYATTEL